MKLIIIILILTLSTVANGCRPNFTYANELRDTSENAYNGIVTGLINSSLENSLDSDFESEAELIVVPATYSIRVYITDTIRGKKTAKVKIGSTFCGSAIEIDTKVFLFSNTDETKMLVLTHEEVKENYPDAYLKLTK
jgi:hypothetical protein